jgi:hypothetical protein
LTKTRRLIFLLAGAFELALAVFIFVAMPHTMVAAAFGAVFMGVAVAFLGLALAPWDSEP